MAPTALSAEIEGTAMILLRVDAVIVSLLSLVVPRSWMLDRRRPVTWTRLVPEATVTGMELANESSGVPGAVRVAVMAVPSVVLKEKDRCAPVPMTWALGPPGEGGVTGALRLR